MAEKKTPELIARLQVRQAAFGLSDCPNGPDEDGTWPCDPQVVFGGGWAQCQVCGREGNWPQKQVVVERGEA